MKSGSLPPSPAIRAFVNFFLEHDMAAQERREAR